VATQEGDAALNESITREYHFGGAAEGSLFTRVAPGGGAAADAGEEAPKSKREARQPALGVAYIARIYRLTPLR
jgi:hypothetical protein